ncbi:MAG: hypothetical protein QW334_00120 [Thermofilum sp.]
MGNNVYLVCKCCGSRVLHLGKFSRVKGNNVFYSSFSFDEVRRRLLHLNKHEQVADETSKIWSVNDLISALRMIANQGLWRFVDNAPDDWS